MGAGLFSLFWIVFQLDGGWTQMAEVSSEKFTLFNLTTDPAVGFTLWVALLAVPFQNLSAFGVDQLNAQRMFCCRDARDARKAMITSSSSSTHHFDAYGRGGSFRLLRADAGTGWRTGNLRAG